MAIKQQINHRAIALYHHSLKVKNYGNKKHRVTPLYHLSIKVKDYGIREQEIFYIHRCFSASPYIERGRKLHF